MQDHRFITRDGLDLPVRIWLPDEAPKALLVALHGFNDYANSFVEPANFWRRAGIGTYAYDQRGFGKTDNPGYWPGIDALTGDAADMVQILRRRYPGVPVYLLGDSMGGAVAAVTAANGSPGSVDGIILMAPAVWARDTMNPFQSGLLWVAAHSVPWMTVSGRGLDIQPSDNIGMLHALSRDPLVLKDARIDTLYGLVDLMDTAMADAAKLRGPVFVLYGDRDEVVPREPMMEFLRRLTDADAELRAAFYPKGYHMLVRDKDGETPMRDIEAWIFDHGGSLPSGADARARQALAAR